MSTFLYKGLNEDYSYSFGSCSNIERNELLTELEKLNIASIEIFDTETPYSKKKYKLVKPKELSIFCKQISVMFFSYITIMDGLLLLSEQTENTVLKTTLLEIYTFIEKGFSFSDAISMYPHVFDDYLIQMTKIGEQSGNLDLVFDDLSNYYDREYEIRKKIKNAVIYPVSLSVITCFIFYYMVEKIFPLFDSILSTLGGELSETSRNLMAFSTFVQSFFIIIIFVLIAIAGYIYIQLSKDKGKYRLDKFKATAPYISFVTTRIITARFSRSLALLLKSGIDIHTAIDKSSVLITNRYIIDKYTIAKNSFMQGETLSNALKDVEVFPSLFIKMVAIGETTGNLDEMLQKTTDIYEEEAYDAINKMARTIEPILITILTIIMGILLLTIILPMVTIMNVM